MEGTVGRDLGKTFRENILEELRDGGEGDEVGREFPEAMFTSSSEYSRKVTTSIEKEQEEKGRRKEDSPIVGPCPLSASALRLGQMRCGFLCACS